MIITIDGPAGSGKTTVARLVAHKLNIKIVRSGLLYRAAAFVFLRQYGFVTQECIDQSNCVVDKQAFDVKVRQLMGSDCAVLSTIWYDYKSDSLEPFVTIDGIDCTEILNHEWMGPVASIASQNACVRLWANEAQRAVGRTYSIIAEGRDCGSFVFPDAEHKFYLMASLQVRAQRIGDDSSRHLSGNAQAILADVAERDKRDESRDVAPLIVPDGATVIDSSHLTLDQVVDLVIKQVISE